MEDEVKEKKYKYFISYSVYGNYAGIGVGNTEIERDKKIDSIIEIREIEEKLKEGYKKSNVVINNYKELQ